MKNQSFPVRLGTLVISAMIASTLSASAQDATACDDCESVSVEAVQVDDFDIVSLEMNPSIVEKSDEVLVGEAVEYDTAAIEDFAPEVDWAVDGEPQYDIYPSLAVEPPMMAEEVTPVLAVDESEPVLAPDVSAGEASEVLQTSSEEIMADGPIMTASAGPVAAQPQKSHVHHIPVAAQGNMCTDKRTYVTWLCSWQGFERP